MRSNNFSIKFEGTPEQIAIVKQMGSKNRSESMAAQEAVAEVVSTPILQVIETYPAIANLYQVEPFDEGTPATLPLDVYFDVAQRGYLQVWTSTTAGGLAYSMPTSITELPVVCYELQAAVALRKSYLRAARLNVLAASLERLGQEVLKKQDINGANIMMAGLANARVANKSGTAQYNLIRAGIAGVLTLNDFNALWTKFARINASWVGGTPVNPKREVTDMVMSPEAVAQVRSIAYQPVNTRVPYQGTLGYVGAAIPAPEALRNEIYNAGGIPTIYGKSIIECFELGTTSQNGEYSQIFSNYAGSTAFVDNAGTSSAAYTPSTEDLVVGLNLNGFNLVRLRQNGQPSAFNILPDDQFFVRSDTLGYYGGLTEGYVCADQRQMVGLIY
jgi:hypothetical protein